MRIKWHLLMGLVILMSILFPITGRAYSAQTQLTWYGQSAYKIVTPNGHVILVDPWLQNPLNKTGKADLEALTRVDLILISHGHFDHVGDAAAIATKTKARLVATYDLGSALAAYGGFPKDQMGYDTLGNFGGTLHFFENEVAISFIPAVHSSSVNSKSLGLNTDDTLHYAGNPSGFLIQIHHGPTIYHTGDTDVFSDMSLIKRYGAIDIMLACIGGHFTMGPQQAAEAVVLVNPKMVIPMHYGTFPGIMTGTVTQFQKALKIKGLQSKLHTIAIHQTIRL